jgi:hypothetical protein
MAEEATPQVVALPAPSEALPAHTELDKNVGSTIANGTAAVGESPLKDGATESATDRIECKLDTFFYPPLHQPRLLSHPAKNEDTTNNKQFSLDNSPEDKPAPTQEDAGIKEDMNRDPSAALVTHETGEGEDPTVETPGDKSKARRKSGGVPEHKKKLNKKASKAKIMHTDAKPGDYYMIRLKGYPLWPGIIPDEAMLPSTLLRTRPITAARFDGTYGSGYEDGGPKVKDRTFPVMYLHTNEL